MAWAQSASTTALAGALGPAPMLTPRGASVSSRLWKSTAATNFSIEPLPFEDGDTTARSIPGPGSNIEQAAPRATLHLDLIISRA
eukprot:4483280-Pyramimonas_sp.AAC.1